MGYRFVFGASGAGKSYQLKKEVIQRAGDALGHFAFNGFLYIVPEQYTMQTQKDLVLASKHGGIMNVDVLSFGRLSHRIFEELGTKPLAALDDVGKSLILRRIAATMKDDLVILGSRLERPGMVSEVKSMISEFMQYGLGVEDVKSLADYAGQNGQGALESRLQDLAALYQGFLDYEKDRFITGEEMLDLLAEGITQSKLIRESVVIFDGFTGFTPVQYRVLKELMHCAKEVVFALTVAADGGRTVLEAQDLDRPFTESEQQDLFYLTRKTIYDITRYAKQVGAVHEKDIDLNEAGKTPVRFQKNPALAHLERSLFRYPMKAFSNSQNTGASKPLSIFCASTPEEEARELCIRIRTMIRMEGYAFRDFGVVCGDLGVYEDAIRKMAAVYDIPVYIDTTRGVKQNPLTETIRGAHEMAGGAYTYETVFRLLRAGLAQMEDEEIDLLENYCLARGIHTKKQWLLPFSAEVEAQRVQLLAMMAPLLDLEDKTAAGRTKALYAFLTGISAQQQLEHYADRFAQEGDAVREKEYEQIYRAVIDLMDQIYGLIGDEKISGKDYLDLMVTGFDEIRLGVLPQQVDRVPVGDIERSRLTEKKVLFFLGANDGNVPRNTSKGGLISDLDREFLAGSGEELSPTPREQMYIQRLYLYLNMTKETDRLIVSFTRTSGDGASIRPSYLIAQLRQMFPEVEIEDPESTVDLRPDREDGTDRLIGTKDSRSYLAQHLRAFVDGGYQAEPVLEDLFLTVYGFCHQEEERMRRLGGDSAKKGATEKIQAGSDVRLLTRAALAHYDPKPISKETAKALYGRVIRGSVTRLEQASQCYLKHYLKYGVRLRERDTRTFEPRDAGTILHESIQKFSQKMQEKGNSWSSFSMEEGETLMSEVLRAVASEYNDQQIYDKARTQYGLKRMQRVLNRTLEALQYQVQAGEFEPAAFELAFGENSEIRFKLSNGGELILVGRIDRVDLCRKDDREYIKIVDYKSGVKDLDMEKIKSGLQLQLLFYMDAVRDMEQGKNPDLEIEPAGLLYYHFDDPMLTGKDAVQALLSGEAGGDESGMEREKLAMMKKLRPKGLVNDSKEVLALLDHSMSGTSTVVPVSVNKDGGLSKTSHVFSREQYDEMVQNMRTLICDVAEHILEGEVVANPVELDSQKTACTYCSYKDVCGFDPKTPGYRYRSILDADDDEEGEIQEA